MLRAAVGLAILAACVLCGYHFTSKLSERPRIIQTFLTLFDTAASRMQYTHDDLYAVFSDNAFGYEFDRIRSFSSQWDEMLSGCRSVIRADDYQVLEEFANGLGTSDLESQLRHIAMYKTLLSERLEDAKKEQENKANLYRVLPFSLGLTIAILLL